MENMNHPSLAHGISFVAIATAGLIAFAIILIPMIFYILTLQKALNRCAPENQAMQPGMVWLLLIPCFGIIWSFFVVINLAKSLGAEFQKRGLAEEPEPGKMLGLIMCGLMVAAMIPFIGGLFGLGGLVCWILYWIKIAGYSAKLAS
jgi:hypothetical protein